MAFINAEIQSEGLLNTKSFRSQLTRVTTSDSTYSLVTSSENNIVFDGTTANQKIAMTDATSINVGHEYYFLNDSNQLINIYNNSKTASLINLYPNSRIRAVLKDGTTSNGQWIFGTSSGAFIGGYSFFASYNGNANAGRYLEIFPNIGSDEAPYLIIGSLSIVAITFGTSALNTGTLGVFKTTDLVNPYLSISLNNQNANTLTGLFYPVSSGDKLAIKVSSGTFNKPFCAVYIGGS